MNKDREKIYHALSLWINYIETGKPNVSKDCLIRMCAGDKDIQRILSETPTLSPSQVKSLEELRLLRDKVIMGGEL